MRPFTRNRRGPSNSLSRSRKRPSAGGWIERLADEDVAAHRSGVGDRRRVVEPAQGQRFGQECVGVEFARRDVEDRRDRIERAQRRAHGGEPGGALVGGDEIALGEADAVGERRLPLRFAVGGERRLAVDRVDQRRHAGDAEARRQPRVGGEREQDRRRIGEAGRLEDDARERRDRRRRRAGRAGR